MFSRRTFLWTATLFGIGAVAPAKGQEATRQALVLAVGLSLPPYVIADEQRGMEYDMVKEALALAGYELRPKFVAFGNAPTLLRDGRVDGAMTMQAASGVEAYYSEVYITYHNYAMTLASRGLHINRVADLANKSIIAFQNAHLFLGPVFAQVIQDNSGYREVAEQYHQNLELFAGKIEVVVADRNIFEWYNRDPRVTQTVDTTQPVTYHNIFAPTPYHIAFRHEKVRDAFNDALATLKASGQYDAIVARYTSKP